MSEPQSDSTREQARGFSMDGSIMELCWDSRKRCSSSAAGTARYGHSGRGGLERRKGVRLAGDGTVEAGHRVLQLGELGHRPLADDVRPHGHHLPSLDVGRPELLHDDAGVARNLLVALLEVGEPSREQNLRHLGQEGNGQAEELRPPLLRESCYVGRCDRVRSGRGAGWANGRSIGRLAGWRISRAHGESERFNVKQASGMRAWSSRGRESQKDWIAVRSYTRGRPSWST